MSLDIASMLQDLLETEAELTRQQSSSLKSVSFQEGDTPVTQTITFDEDEPVGSGEVRTSQVARPILKTPSVIITPSVVPLVPTEYCSEDFETGSESDSLDFQSDGEDEQNQDEDIEYEELELFQEESNVTNFEQILEVLDEFIMNHQSQLSPDSYSLPNSEKVTPVQGLVTPLDSSSLDTPREQISFYGQQISDTPVEEFNEIRKSSLPTPKIHAEPIRVYSERNAILDKIEQSFDRESLQSGELEKSEAEQKNEQEKSVVKNGDVKKITTRVYIEDARQFKTKVLNCTMTSKNVVDEVSQGLPVQEWALFELCNDFGIERPLRDWEIVTDVLSAWDQGSSNAIVLKTYGYRATLSPSHLRGRYPRIQGYVYLELKPGKWYKRFCVLKEYLLYYYKEGNNTQTETLLCNLSQFDIYTMTKPRKKAPTAYSFAIRSDMNLSLCKDKTEYVHYFCVEREERLIDWVLALRMAKSERMYQGTPKIATPILNAELVQTPTEIPEDTIPLGALIDKTNKKSSKDRKEKVKRKKSKPKPLIDLSTVNNCKNCGCSEYVQYPKRDACPYCYHVHLPNTT